MKRMKIAAAAVVLVMLASATIIGINATQYDAEGNGETNTAGTDPTYIVDLTKSPSIDVVLNSNINYYYQLANDANGVSITWKAGINLATLSNQPDISAETEIVDGDKEVNIKPSIAGTEFDEKKLIVKLSKISYTVSDKILYKKPVDTIYVQASVTVTVGGNQVSLDSVVYTLILNHTPEYKEFVVNFVHLVNSTQTMQVVGKTAEESEAIIAKYDFYTENLPKGLSMMPDGKISGIVEKPTDAVYHVTIELKNKTTGNIGTAQLSVNVTDFNFKVGSATSDGQITTELPKIGDKYYIEQGKNFYVQAKSDGANCVSALNISSGINQVFKLNEHNIADITNCTKGSGTYRVYIGYAEGENPTNISEIYAYFDIYVIGNVTGVGSTIIVGSR